MKTVWVLLFIILPSCDYPAASECAIRREHRTVHGVVRVCVILCTQTHVCIISRYITVRIHAYTLLYSSEVVVVGLSRRRMHITYYKRVYPYVYGPTVSDERAR